MSRRALIIATDRYQDTGLRPIPWLTEDAERLADVLADPAIGGFQVRTLLNNPALLLSAAIEDFFADRDPDDLLLLYVACHGVMDEEGRLYFAAHNTRLQRLQATAVAVDFVNEQMTRSRSRWVALLLDCLYSTVFPRRVLHPPGTAPIDPIIRFGRRGIIVLTASSTIDYAFENAGLLHGRGQPSVFTRALVQGLETGEADRDGDGRISVDDLYEYLYDQVRAVAPKQTPRKWEYGIEGNFPIAYKRKLRPIPRPPAETPRASVQIPRPPAAPPPAEIIDLLEGRSARGDSDSDPTEKLPPAEVGQRASPRQATDRIVSTGFAPTNKPNTPLATDQPLMCRQHYYFWMEIGPIQLPGSIELKPTSLPPDLPNKARLTVVLFSYPQELQIQRGAEIGELDHRLPTSILLSVQASMRPCLSSGRRCTRRRLKYTESW